MLPNRFHDVDGIADFLILKQHYDQALQREWSTGTLWLANERGSSEKGFFSGDSFRCFIDDCWWPGTLVKREPFDVRHENSPFQCYIIRWDSGESEERLSPWDIFKRDDPGPNHADETSRDRSLHLACPSDEMNPMKMLSYQPDADEWPPHGVDAEQERLLQGVDTLMQMDVSELFRSPGKHRNLPYSSTTRSLS